MEVFRGSFVVCDAVGTVLQPHRPGFSTSAAAFWAVQFEAGHFTSPSLSFPFHKQEGQQPSRRVAGGNEAHECLSPSFLTTWYKITVNNLIHWGWLFYFTFFTDYVPPSSTLWHLLILLVIYLHHSTVSPLRAGILVLSACCCNRSKYDSTRHQPILAGKWRSHHCLLQGGHWGTAVTSHHQRTVL